MTIGAHSTMFWASFCNKFGLVSIIFMLWAIGFPHNSQWFQMCLLSHDEIWAGHHCSPFFLTFFLPEPQWPMQMLWLWFRLYLGLRTYFSFSIGGNFVVEAQTKTLDLIRPKYWKKTAKEGRKSRPSQ